MAIDFPASPTNGQTHTVGSTTWTWDGTKWGITSGAAAGATDKIEEGNTSAEVIDTGSDGRFVVTTEGSERARVDSSGRLLVGTSSARAFGGLGTPSFQQEGTGYETASGAYTLNQNTGDSPWLILAKSRGSSLGSFTVVNSGDVLGRISFQGADGAVFRQGASITAEVDATPGSGDMPGRLVFSTTSDGASSPTQRTIIDLSGTLRPAADNAYQLGSLGTRWKSVWAVNGTIQTSDGRQKLDITSSALGTDFIKSLKPVSYRWKVGGNIHNGTNEDGSQDVTSVEGSRTHWGFIAQEVKQAVDAAGVDFGGWVLTDKDDPDSQQALRYDQFIAPLTKALQEALEKIETLEAQNADILARLTALEGGTP